jgi:agmatinase
VSESSHLPFVFGGLEPALSDFEKAAVLIWPVPFERTVSYGRGTGEGPNSIINASRNMELYDEELRGEPCSIGIHTLPAIRADRDPEEMIPALEQEARRLFETGKFLCTLGGEHSISPPLVRACNERFSNLSVLQIDAHADLRASYDGTPYSHASAMRRILETCPAVQVGLRSLSAEEARVIPQLPTRVFYAKDLQQDTAWYERVADALTENVYLTLDIDGLDPSLVPSTGTPEPGGLSWYEALGLLRTVANKRNIIAMDVVEVSGSGSEHVSSFVAAKLIYKTLGYIFRARIPVIAGC